MVSSDSATLCSILARRKLYDDISWRLAWRLKYGLKGDLPKATLTGAGLRDASGTVYPRIMDHAL